MTKTPEQEARETIDKMLDQSGWDVQDRQNVNIFAKKGVAIREFPLKSGHGYADYLLYVDGQAAGVVEAKKKGTTLTGVEIQSDKYKTGLPADLPAWHRPLPFCYQSTGVETRFTNDLDPVPRSRDVFSFHRPKTIEEWLNDDTCVPLKQSSEKQMPYGKPSTLNLRLRHMPELIEKGLWSAQIRAIKNLEKSFAENRPRALIQMATGSGKTFTAISFIYRLIKFAKGNDFTQKITYKTTGRKPEDLIAEFRNSYNPRIVVTVDMIATGTDIKPLEIVMFMRSVKSRGYFDQMKGRGVRVINDDDLQSVTSDAKTKDHYIIVDAVGVCEQDKTDSKPMDRKKSVSFEKLLQAVSLGNTEPDVISSIAVRIARLNKNLTEEDNSKIIELTDSRRLSGLTSDLVNSINPDKQIEQAKEDNPSVEKPAEEQIQQTVTNLIKNAVKPLYNPELRNLLIEIKKKNEQIIDHVSPDQVIEAGFSAEALEKAKGMIESFKKFIEENKDEISALQIFYSRPYKMRLRFEDIKELADTIKKPPHLWTENNLWMAYAALEKSKVRGASGPHILTDIVSLVRFALDQENELVPFPEKVDTNFKAWLAQQKKRFTEEQKSWLYMSKNPTPEGPVLV